MTARLSRYHPLSWALWLKFLVGITVGFVVLAIPAFIFVRAGVYDLSAQNARAFVSETGLKHASAVTDALSEVRAEVDSFVTGTANNRLLTGFLLRDVRTSTQNYLARVSASTIADLLRQELLSSAVAPFESVRLLDRDGNLLVDVDLALTSYTAKDESLSPAYRAALNAQLQGRSSALAASPGQTAAGAAPVVEIAQTIYWRSGTPIGYLVATLNNNRVFFTGIRLENTLANYSAYTFLTTAQGVVIAPAEARTRAGAAIQSPITARALGGQSGVDSYEAADKAEYIGYYTPIGDSPFALITQAPAAIVYTNTLGFFQVRTFVVIGGVLVLLALLVLLFNQMITPSLSRLRSAAQALSNGSFDVPIPDAARGDEIGLLAASFVSMREQIRVLIGDLEDRIAARTRDINATQEISRFAATQRDMQLLLNRVVDLIVERFPNIYHAQIFLIDDNADAVLRASTGEAGQKLLSRGHRLGVGSVSVIGQVTQQGRLIVARDAAASQVHRRNEFLPETRAELAIPLRIGDHVLGALDVQSRIRDAFQEDQVAVLQTMADQIAVAIENARLYEESVRRVRQVEESNRAATRHAWQAFMQDQRASEITREAGYQGAGDALADTSDLRREALARGDAVFGTPTGRDTIPVAIPIQLRGQVLGAVEWEIPMRTMSEEKLELARELANRLALSLDNARLFQESQRATERERLVNTIAAKLTAQTTIDDILQTAVREVGQALRAPQVSIRLRSAAENGNGSGSAIANGHSDNGNGNGSGNGDHPARSSS